MPESFKAANSPDLSPDETSKVKYVLSGQPTGWAAMAKEVREFDEEKVKSCKEDIDTLLVFAGLFSAVLSAFLIAAYPALQPDRMDIMVYTLQLIATQTAGYKQTGDVIITSGAPPPPLPSFTPAASDIRINILWFASLVISLVTASFAMLVKQWLREFLAVEVPSPQARLRVRHFREPQLLKWKVYEISALLPLLLQLSLGLFFIGLCYFTAAIHSGIGYTTLPLVVGWALFFFTSTALPIFFPRCPYRTTLLKTAVSQLHRGIGHLADWSRDMLRPNSNSRFGTRNHPSLSNRPHSSDVSTFCRTLSKGILRRILPDRQSLPDERNIVKDQDQDVDILLSVDAIQANDELLCTAISEALTYGRPDWESVVNFAIRILAHRLPTVAPSDRMLLEWPFSDCFPFSNARPQVIEAIIGILSDNIKRNIPLSYNSVLVPGNTGMALHRHLLCLFSVLIAAADVSASAQLVTSNAGIRDILQWLLCHSSDYSGLWKDWIQLASSQLAEPEEQRKVAYRLLHVLTWLVEPLNLSVPDGVALFEILTETNLDTLWKTYEYIDWAILSGWYTSIKTPVAYLSILLCTEFQRSISCPIREREAIARQVLDSTLRLHVAVLSCEARIYSRSRTFRVQGTAMDHIIAGDYSQILIGQITTSEYLAKAVVHAMRSESGARLFIDALLEVDDGALQPTSILFVKPCLPKGYIPPYRSPKLEHRMATTPLHALANRHCYLPDLTGVLANLKPILSERLTHGDITLSSALQLCQAAMVILLCIPPYTADIRLEAREIFAQFGPTLRSLIAEQTNIRLTAIASGESYGSQLRTDHTMSGADIAHACLSALSAHDYYENLNPKGTSDNIFPDDLVEILMELDTSQSYRLPTSHLRRRRINEKRAILALEYIRELWPDIPEAEADITGCTNDVDAGEIRVDKDSRANSRVHINLDSSRLTKVDSVHSTLESTHGETAHGHDIADNAEMPGADRDSSVNSISAD